MSDDGSAVSRPRDVLNLTNVGFEKTRTEMMSTITCVPAVILFWCLFFYFVRNDRVDMSDVSRHTNDVSGHKTSFRL